MKPKFVYTHSTIVEPSIEDLAQMVVMLDAVDHATLISLVAQKIRELGGWSAMQLQCITNCPELTADGRSLMSQIGNYAHALPLPEGEVLTQQQTPAPAPAMTTPTPSTFPCAAEAVDAQQTRQDRLDELYAQDGRQSPEHPMHGLYTGLVQATSTTTPENVMTDEFALFALQDGRKIAIRKSSVTAFFPAKYSESTVIEYPSSDVEGVVVNEGFDKVCAKLGIAAPQQEPQP